MNLDFINAIIDVMSTLVLLATSFGCGMLFIMWLEPWDADDISSGATVKNWIKNKFNYCREYWKTRKGEYQINEDWP